MRLQKPGFVRERFCDGNSRRKTSGMRKLNTRGGS